MISYKIESKNFPGAGFYTIKLEDKMYNCYWGKPSDIVEKSFEDATEAKKYCTEKLKEKVKEKLNPRRRSIFNGL